MVTITVDMEKCQHYGQCCFEASEVFALNDDGHLEYVKQVDESQRSAVDLAADVCPMQAISVN